MFRRSCHRPSPKSKPSQRPNHKVAKALESSVGIMLAIHCRSEISQHIYHIYIYIYPYISYIHIPSKQEGSSYYSLVPLHGLKVSFLVPRGASTVRVVKRPAKAKATTGNRSFSGHRMSFVRIYGCNSTPHQ